MKEQHILIGILISGNEICGQEGEYGNGVYSSILSNREWISEELKMNEAKFCNGCANPTIGSNKKGEGCESQEESQESQEESQEESGESGESQEGSGSEEGNHL